MSIELTEFSDDKLTMSRDYEKFNETPGSALSNLL